MRGIVLLLLAMQVQAAPVLLASGLKNPESTCIGPDGRVYVTEIGERDTPGDGRVCVIDNGTAKPFASKLDDPRGICYSRPHKAFFVNDNTHIKKIAPDGTVSVWLAAEKFPVKPIKLNDIAVEEKTQTLLVSDTGTVTVYAIEMRSGKVNVIADATSLPGLKAPNGVLFDGVSQALVGDMDTGLLHRVKISDRSHDVVADGLKGSDGLIWDRHGRLFITINKTGEIYAIPRAGEKPVLLNEKLPSAADGCLSMDGQHLVIPDMKSGSVVEISTAIPGWEVDTTPLPVKTELAFPKLQFTGWDDGSETGRVIPLRPILLTHANDGTDRNFVCLQQGTIHVFPNDDGATKTKVFLDISKKAKYADKMNEEGLLGLAFHPDYKTNGEFFVFYTDVAATKMTNVVSRFKVSKDPDTADAGSEEVLLRIEKPYWNHDGGTICFGNDGYLYIAHGDGGLGGDPHGNGQSLKTWLGKILRIDVNMKSDGKPYGIPKDNPFVSVPNAKPEIYAYGLRNVWRMAVDKPTGRLWAGDVGQDLYEEINIIQRGGNYGWSLRESLHPFGKNGIAPRKDIIEPVWEYDHEVGKSITGGFVYHGSKVPSLKGKYLYADYVSQKVWGLTYDGTRVTGNQPIAAGNVAVMSFGEDAAGEAYIMGASPNGKGIHRLVVSGP